MELRLVQLQLEADTPGVADALMADSQLAAVVAGGRARRLPSADLSSYTLAEHVHLVGGSDPLVLARPWTPIRILIHDQRVAGLLGELLLLGRPPHIQLQPQIQPLWQLLAATGFLAPTSATGSGWEFHDALMATRSRSDGAVHGYGKHPPAGPESGGAPEPGRPLPTVPVTRHERPPSCRVYHSDAPTLAQLGEFLQGWAATRSITRWSGLGSTRSLPYPAAGGLSPLRLVLLGRPAEPLPVGGYEYRPDTHEVVDLHLPAGPVTRRLATLNGHAAAAAPAPAAVLMVIDWAQLARVYRSIVLSSALKTVGAAMHAAYLAGAGCGLGVCALGGGPASLPHGSDLRTDTDERPDPGRGYATAAATACTESAYPDTAGGAALEARMLDPKQLDPKQIVIGELLFGLPAESATRQPDGAAPAAVTEEPPWRSRLP